MSGAKGKVVVVTGAGGGIGKSICECFASNGAAVAVMDCNGTHADKTANALKSKGYIACSIAVDVTDFDQLSKARTMVLAELGQVDVLVNNAGISPKHNGVRAEAVEMDVTEWRRVVDVNLTGCFNMVRTFAPMMKARGSGTIINMSSVAGRAYLDLVGIHYSTTKAALIGFTRHLAGELGPSGITVNAIAPGRIDTPMMRMVSQELNHSIINQTPLKRLGRPEDVANLTHFLASDEARFITGQVCDVAGGWCMT